MKKLKVGILFIIIFVLGIGLGGLWNWKLSSSSKSLEEIDLKLVESKDKFPIEEVVLEKKTSLKIVSVGDIMFHGPQIKAAYSGGTYDFKPSFKYVKPYIEGADIAIGNFETVVGGKEKGYRGYPSFNSPDETLDGLKDTGFDILSSVNNHSLDGGKSGLIRTIDLMKEKGLVQLGTFKEKTSRVYIREVNEIKTGYLAYSYGFNGNEAGLSEEDMSYMVNKIDREKISQDIAELKDKQVDFIIAVVHWGNEYARESSQDQRDLANFMAGLGVDMILGSHPHVIQESEILKFDGRETTVIYSMGNFISNQRKDTMGNSYSEDGVIVDFVLEKDHANNKTQIKSLEFIPTWVYKYWSGDKNHYEILPVSDALEGKLAIELKGEIKSRLEASYKNTMDKISISSK